MQAAHCQGCGLAQGATVDRQGYGALVVLGVIGGAETILGINRFIETIEAKPPGNLGDTGQGLAQGPLRADGRGVHRRRQGPDLLLKGDAVGQGPDQGLHAVAAGALPHP